MSDDFLGVLIIYGVPCAVMLGGAVVGFLVGRRLR